MAQQVERVILVVLDSVDCGDAPDAAAYGNEGSKTLSIGGFHLPHMAALGLGHLTEISAGKDTTTGHGNDPTTPSTDHSREILRK